MNVLTGTVRSIKVHGNLSLVKVEVDAHVLSSVVIETPESAEYLKEGAPVNVMFKETEVIIGASHGPMISLQNQIPVTIISIDRGVLLAELIMKFRKTEIRSIITSNAVDQMKLATGSSAIAMIKTNEVMLSL